MKTRLIASLTLAAFATAPSLGVAQQSPVATQAAPVAAPTGPVLDGTWRYAGGAGERAALEASVGRTVAGMGFIIEGMARGRILERNAISDTIRVTSGGGFVEYAPAGRRALRSPADGTEVATMSLQGDAIRVRQRYNGRELVRTFTASEGGGTTTFTLVNPTRATLHVVMRSPRLPRPLDYTLTYTR